DGIRDFHVTGVQTCALPILLAAMQRPMLGHLDPDLHDVLHEVVDMLRSVWHASEGVVLPLSATGTSAMEAGIVNLVAPGETVVEIGRASCRERVEMAWVRCV